MSKKNIDKNSENICNIRNAMVNIGACIYGVSYMRYYLELDPEIRKNLDILDHDLHIAYDELDKIDIPW